MQRPPERLARSGETEAGHAVGIPAVARFEHRRSVHEKRKHLALCLRPESVFPSRLPDKRRGGELRHPTVLVPEHGALARRGKAERIIPARALAAQQHKGALAAFNRHRRAHCRIAQIVISGERLRAGHIRQRLRRETHGVPIALPGAVIERKRRELRKLLALERKIYRIVHCAGNGDLVHIHPAHGPGVGVGLRLDRPADIL